MVEVKLFASLRTVAGEKGFLTDAASVGELLREAAERYGEDFAKRLQIATVLVNGKNIAHLRWKRTRLKDGDVVSLFPPLAGG
ncbi:MAG TPA: MoaD/ThiS family protein [Firmicutes bacterium]|jgi:molybdopterin synthase sulfur carrier subunit|nr:MoaD/ThiS family protein [Bacillota bacterium]